MTTEEAAPCRHPGAPSTDVVIKVATIISDLAKDEKFLFSKGLTAAEYQHALPVAVQQMRGSHSAKNRGRREFLVGLFEEMKARGIIDDFLVPEYGKNTIYRLKTYAHGDIAIIQKGCPDGKHSSEAWEAPSWAAETYLWWLCPSLSAEPGEHIAKGVGRLRRHFFSDRPDALSGVIFHNELCGTSDRPCPKADRSIEIDGVSVPPPCIYVMPERDSEVSQWNWQGDTKRVFPAMLLSMFGIPAATSPAFIGFVGFQKRGVDYRSTISIPFGPGRATIFRS
jgi:hypothetical protein